MRERSLPWEDGDEAESLDCRIRPSTVYLGRKGYPNPCAVTVVLGRRTPGPSPATRREDEIPEPVRTIAVPKPVSKGRRITKAMARAMGARGGKRRSARKAESARRNLARVRPRRWDRKRGNA